MFHARTASGHRITTNQAPATSNDALGLAIHFWRRTAVPHQNGTWDRRKEPVWHDPTTLLTLSTVFAFSNKSAIQAALSTQSRTLIDLPVARNFYAHRAQATLLAALSLAPHYGIPIQKNLSGLLLSRPINRTQPLILDWIDDIDFAVEMLCF